ncbi:MAG: hypothetical protein R6X13_07740 [bacterium]
MDNQLSKELQALAPFVGRTWRGTLNESTPEKPMVDVSRWERALGGMAVRNLHSVNDGEYGGETVVYWDRERQCLAFFYFTTAGFFTRGTMTVEGSRMTSVEQVVGSSTGITEVRATAELLEDGRLRTQSVYLQLGKVVPGHGAVYEPAPCAEVKFR